MFEDKPLCADFIIAAARKIRIPSGATAPGIATGARLNQVWNITLEEYTWDEFVEALNSLLRDSTIRITAHTRYNTPVLMKPIPKRLPPPDSWRWPINQEGEYSANSKDYLSSIKLYVVADGLPEVVKKLLDHKPKKKPRVRAREIIEAMR